MGRATLSSAEVRASRLNIWKMKPMVRERRIAPSSSREPGDVPAQQAVASRASGGPAGPRICMKVDLPEPEGPMMATNSPSSMSRSIPLRTLSSPPPTL